MCKINNMVYIESNHPLCPANLRARISQLESEKERLTGNLEIWESSANDSDAKVAVLEKELAASKAEVERRQAEVERGNEQLGRAKELWHLVKQDNMLLESEIRMLKQAIEMLQKALDQRQ